MEIPYGCFEDFAKNIRLKGENAHLWSFFRENPRVE